MTVQVDHLEHPIGVAVFKNILYCTESKRNAIAFKDLTIVDVSFDLQCKITRPCQPSKQIYDYQNANWDNFRLELSHVSWDTIFKDDVSIHCVWNNWKRVFF